MRILLHSSWLLLLFGCRFDSKQQPDSSSKLTRYSLSLIHLPDVELKARQRFRVQERQEFIDSIDHYFGRMFTASRGEFIYDSSGRLYINAGIIDGLFKYYYDSTEWPHRMMGSKGCLIQNYVYRYYIDSIEDNLYQNVYFANSNNIPELLITVNRYHFANNGLVTDLLELNPDNSFRSRTLYKYNNQGQLNTEQYYRYADKKGLSDQDLITFHEPFASEILYLWSEGKLRYAVKHSAYLAKPYWTTDSISYNERGLREWILTHDWNWKPTRLRYGYHDSVVTRFSLWN